MKQILKKLSAAIDAIDVANEHANEMSALIDHGEWGQSAPDHGPALRGFKVHSREELLQMIAEAEGYCDKFNREYPQPETPEDEDRRDRDMWDLNPWYYIQMNLEYVLNTAPLMRDQDPPRRRQREYYS